MTDDTNETRLEFPCDFTLKVIGKADSEFEAQVVSLVRAYFPNLGEGAIKLKPSKNQNYIALSVTVHATSKQPLDDLYQALSDNPLVLFAL